jgi:hypothetical protein
MMKKKEVWPEILYVVKEIDGKDTWLIVWEDKSDMEDKEVVGVYKFQKAQKVNKITELVDV